MGERITTDQFRRTIQDAVLQRSTQYTDSYPLSIRWERDDTLAHQDVGHFRSLLTTLRLAEPREVVIAADDLKPGLTARTELEQILVAAKQTNGRAIVVVHYAGRGAQDNNSLLLVERTRGNAFCAMAFLISTVIPSKGYGLGDEDKVDVLFIFDCCYSFIARRAPQPKQRIVEVIAATDENQPEAFSSPRNTITAKLAGEVKRRERDGHRYVEIADVVATLRDRPNAVKKPSHGLRLGAVSICIPFSGLVAVDPQRLPSALRVVFGVHIADNLTATTLRSFVNWIRTLPENSSITLEGVYPTASTLLILCSPWSTWSKLNGIRGFSFMAEVREGNQMGRLLAPPSGPSDSGFFKKESIPPRRDPAGGKQGS
ncbi:uncharacterized protein APUU_10114S [Aspergillus puulaauensis]|uniref:Uncharacterized protein n=1 Tax=Aspergillus puulaauensis TaxID=1220207 RepID=A0A7R7X9L3_9EURO|nr:uncharacterized protein APUU_10114S [Aspergillus puulaauensis]BCS17286.1 hypothetical protein APUU_10114S [Aspergillus puulaauensis]